MKKKRLDLNELKVKSFVTDVNKNSENTIKGGGNTTQCASFPCPQDTTNIGVPCGNSLFNPVC